MKAFCVLALALLPTTAWSQQSGRLHLKSALAHEQNLPFSSGVVAGDVLYIAGTTGVNPKAARPTSAAAEARIVMDQIEQVVEEAGMTMDDIVSVQVFCSNLADYDAFNGVYRTYFHGAYPARAFVGVNKLLFGARYEVMGIAVRRRHESNR